MTREAVLETLRAHFDELGRFGVRSISLFGSFVRDEAGPESDVDLLVELERGTTLFDFVELKDRLEESLARPVDLTTPDALKKQLRDAILAEAVRVA